MSPKPPVSSTWVCGLAAGAALLALLPAADGGGVPGVTPRQRQESADNLKQIALALLNFESAHRYFPPPAVVSKTNGKPLLSWRVLILPYVEQDQLYREFKLDEPWDSEHNKKLLAQMPKLYAPVVGKTKEPHTTYYQAFVGPGAAFELKPDKAVAFGAKGLRIVDFTDGTANTISVAEAAEPVPWTKPADIAFDPTKAPPKLGGLLKDGFHAAFVDGTVRFIRKVDDATLRALITRAGNEIIDFKKIR